MWLHIILDNGAHQTKCNVNHPKELYHYYLEAKGKAAKRKSGKLFLLGKSYHDSINNENNSRLIIVIGIKLATEEY